MSSNSGWLLKTHIVMLWLYRVSSSHHSYISKYNQYYRAVTSHTWKIFLCFHRYHKAQETPREGGGGVPLCHKAAIWCRCFEQQVRWLTCWFLCEWRICFLLKFGFSFRFIEHGEYKENQYGTSIEAIRSVQAKNKMCVVDVQPEVRVKLQPLNPSSKCITVNYHNTVTSDLFMMQSLTYHCWPLCGSHALCECITTPGSEEAADSGVQALCHIRQTSCSWEQATPQCYHLARRGRPWSRYSESCFLWDASLT